MTSAGAPPPRARPRDTRGAGQRVARASLWLMWVLAALSLTVGTIAHVASDNVVDEGGFTDNITATLRDPAVREALVGEITDALCAPGSALALVRPIVDRAAAAVVGTEAMAMSMRAAARQLHRLLTTRQPDAVALRLSRVGSDLGEQLPLLSPRLAAAVPADIPITLRDIGDQRFAQTTIRAADTVRLLSWLLPLLAVLALLAPVPWLRRRAVRPAVVVVATSGAVVALLGLVLQVRAWLSDSTTLGGAVTATLLHHVAVTCWIAAGGLAAIALAVGVGAAGSLLGVDVRLRGAGGLDDHADEGHDRNATCVGRAVQDQ